MSAPLPKSTRPAEDDGVAVVVAAQNARRTILPCLAALAAQGIGRIVVVANATDGTAEAVRAHFPEVELIALAGPRLVPELWAAGVLRCSEPLIALTNAHMLQAPGWAAALRAAFAREASAGVGGPIRQGRRLGLVDRAIYWLRYSRYAADGLAGPVGDIAGDNAAYRRAALVPYAERIRTAGFWENEIHMLLHAEGKALAWAPAALAEYQGGESFFRFAGQRIAHGRRFGAERMRARTGVRKLLTIAVWPLTPFAFFARIAANTRRVGGAADLAAVLPLLLALLACWSGGELLGDLLGAPAEPLAEHPVGLLDAARAGRQ